MSNANGGAGPATATALTLALSTFNHKRDNEPREDSTTWREFCARVAVPVVRAGKDGALFSPARFEPKRRAKANVVELSALPLDLDHNVTLAGDLPRWRKAGYTFTAYTTHSHKRVTESNKNAEERFRVVLPLASPIPAIYWPALWQWANKMSGEKLDAATKDQSRMMYWPAKADDGAEYYHESHEGRLLDWRELPPLKYAVAAVEGEMAALASAPDGERNNQLFKSAAALGELVAGGVLDQDRVITALEEAAASLGLDAGEIGPTIQSGLRSGLRNPRGLDGDKRHAKPKTDKKAEENAPAEAGQAEQWAIPRPIPEGLLPVPQLPIELIPAAFRGWIYDMADRIQVPLEFPAVPAIVAAASVIGNQARIRPKARDDWAVTPNLWGAVVGRPGVMKSPAIAEALKPLRRLCAEAETRYAEALKAWKFEKEAQKARLEATRKKMKAAAGKGQDLDQFKDDLADAEQPEPTERRYIVNDSTIEKFGALLNQNPNGLLLFRDELTGWFRALDDDRRANDRAFFLECWNGDNSYTYDRIERGTLKIANATASVLGGIQPGPLQAYLRGALGCGEGDDGLLQRFQMAVFPDLPDDFKYVDRWPDTDAKNTAYAVFEALSAIPEIGGESDDDGKTFLRFAPGAQELFVEWYSDLRKEIVSGAFDHPAIEAHAAKYAKLLPALALVFELVNAASATPAFDGFGGAVSQESAETAAAWCDFLLSHARRIYGLGLAATTTYAKAIALRLRAGDLPDKFTPRDIYYRGWSGLTTAESVKEPLDLLEHLGWIKGGAITTGGRPTIQYQINPQISEAEL